MSWSDEHAAAFRGAFQSILREAERGAMAYARCLPPAVVRELADDLSFVPDGWTVWRVAGDREDAARSIAADRAVEIREAKEAATLLLVDTERAGAGMDGIYSAAREVAEDELFKEAAALAERRIAERASRAYRDYARRAVRLGRRHVGLSPWAALDFTCRVLSSGAYPGSLLHLLGLWPAAEPDEAAAAEELDTSLMFVERLLGAAAVGTAPTARIESLRLLAPTGEQMESLERFVRSAAGRPVSEALGELADKPEIWVNSLKIEQAAKTVQRLELTPWRTKAGKVARWSGLQDNPKGDAPPVLMLDPDAEDNGNVSTLDVRWKAIPSNLAKGHAEYRIIVTTHFDEEIASERCLHRGGKEEKIGFDNDAFSDLDESAVVYAKVVLSVVGNESVEPQESEEFIVQFGEVSAAAPGGGGRNVRAFSEGVIELADRDRVSEAASADILREVGENAVGLRTTAPVKAFRVFRPALIAAVERQWVDRNGAAGRWRVTVRASGEPAQEPVFKPFEGSGLAWDRVTSSGARLAKRFAASGGGVAQIYDEKAGNFKWIEEYLRYWAELLESEGARPELALAHTVEVRSLSNSPVGLIVLPSHPLRVAWSAAYDNLVFHAKFDEGAKPGVIRDELEGLDGAMFPALLPGTEPGLTFVFADTLGFHAVGMVSDRHGEPKAAVALLARALGIRDTEAAPTVGAQSANILAAEIDKYLECHEASRLLHVHALRAGDGMTVARAFGEVYKRGAPDGDEYEENEAADGAPAFVLELYPSSGQTAVGGRFIAGVREKRRRGAGAVAEDDRWMLESRTLPGGVRQPRLRWALKEREAPDAAAHIAIAFDTFESRVAAEAAAESLPARPLHAFGLMSFFDRSYVHTPLPAWRGAAGDTGQGEKHPSRRIHSERLTRLRNVIDALVARNLGVERGRPILRTEISPDKAQSLQRLHESSDWVLTLDRNAGMEYFDSPQEGRDVYDAYVIDCVPEREDLGCLRLVTSTANLDEIRTLLDDALDRTGLGHSRRNAEFLLEHIKALSGRLAIRLTGQHAPSSELLALAAARAHCRRPAESGPCWLPLDEGFFVPVDDVRGLLPPFAGKSADAPERPAARPDLVYVSKGSRGALCFRFAEVKYRRHLRTARAPDTLTGIREQVESLRARWEDRYDAGETPRVFRAVRRAKLARVLRFYADKARRYGMPASRHRALVGEIDRMLEKGGDYAFAPAADGDRGWIFCPEYAGAEPLRVSPDDWDTHIFLFGPGILPDSDEPREPPPAEDPGRRTPPPSQPAPNADSGGAADARVEHAEDGDRRGGAEAPGTAPAASGAGEPAIVFGADKLSGAEVRWPVSIRGNPHLLVAGQPGMGKTTCLLNICRQMIDAGILPIVFSYHRDIDEKLAESVGAVRFVDFQGLGFNPLQVLDRESPVAHLDVAGVMRDIFSAIFPELGDIQGERIRRAVKDSFAEAGWGGAEAPGAARGEPPFGRFVEILRADPKPDQGLRRLLGRLEELDDYGFFAAGESHESLWDSDRPVVVRVHTTQNDKLQRAFSFLVFYGLYKDMFRRGLGERITHALVFDEAHRAANLKLIPAMAKECRKFGISLVLASQEARDFDASLYSAIANYLILRLTETDARALVRNVASSQQERGLIDKAKQLDRFHALYFSESRKRPFHIALSH